MAIESAKAFIEKVKNDEDLMKKLAECDDDKSRLKIAQDLGFDFTMEEINEVKDKISDEELDQAAGGASMSCWVAYYGE